ncbi:hypothetical protein ACUTQ5_14685 [Serratia sp. NA_112.1]|uniref:hypothetical protein n=1 Tax=unclassified Serratia (in: enterobacteria) TaxID=2647522 RepID=UPI004046D724
MLIKHTTSVQWQLWIVAFGFFMQTLDTAIVNTALPALAFARVPADTTTNRTLTKEPDTGSTRLQ